MDEKERRREEETEAEVRRTQGIEASLGGLERRLEKVKKKNPASFVFFIF